METPERLSKLRGDLIVSRQETGEGAFFVIKELSSGRFFRLKEPEHFIARQLDGATPLEIVRRRTQEAFGTAPSPQTLIQFVDGLERLGLIESEGPSAGRPVGRKFVRGSLLYLRFKAFDPDRLLECLAGKLGFFFTPHFIVLSALAIVWAVATTVLNGEAIARDVRSLWRFDALLFAWFTVLFVTALHEFAHGLTCKRFGGAVHEMGFMLIYFQPAFYCNISDAWLFPEKRKRLWVTFAGAYFEIFLWALATLAWRATEPRTWIGFVVLVVMATSGFKTLFNLNPLVKLDGYYLLSDALGIPNLRQRSIGYVKGLLGRLWRSIAGSASATPRERRIYVVYGLLAAAYSYWLLSYVVLAFGSYLIARYQGMGLMLFGGLLMMLTRNPLLRLWSAASVPFRRVRAPLGSRRTWILAACAAFGAVLFVGQKDLRVAGEFEVLPIHNADVRAEVEGIIEKIFVDEGMLVHEGDPIGRLADRDYRSELRKNEAQIAEMSARLRLLMAGPRPEEVGVANASVAKAGEQLSRAKKLLNMTEAAFKEQLVAQKDLEEAQAEVAVQGKALEEERGRLSVLLAGNRKEEIEATGAEISRLEVQRDHLVEQMNLLTVTSPITGIVTTPSASLKEKVGQQVNQGDLIAEVYDTRTITAEISVSEKEIADVQVGGPVVVRARAYPHLGFQGNVTAIAAATGGRDEKAEGRAGSPLSIGERTILVRTQIDNSSLMLKPGMTGTAKISCGERRLFDLVTRRFARYLRVELWSLW